MYNAGKIHRKKNDCFITKELMSRLKFISYIAFIVLLNSCYLARAYKFRKFNLTDHEKLPSAVIKKSSMPFSFVYPANEQNYRDVRLLLDSNLRQTNTAAFMVIRNDTVIYENYFNSFSAQSKLPSFSVAKSFVGTLIAIAVNEGYIKSTGEPITTYLPELKKTDAQFEKITIQDVLDMKTNLAFTEQYNKPTSDVIQLGFKNNMRKKALQIKTGGNKGDFEYQSINTQLLSFVLEKATGKKTEQYLQEKIWQPLGMESDATWNTDGKDEVRAFCCLNAVARDFAKFGLLYLHRGRWNNQQIVPEKWIDAIENTDNSKGNNRYKNQWWKSRGTAYEAQGILGQYIYVNPSKNIVVVRLGHRWNHPQQKYIGRFISYLDAQL